MQLRYYEDYEVGEKAISDTYSVDKTELVEYSKKWDPQPFHVDEEAAKASIYGGLTAPSAYIVAVASLLGNTIEPKIAALGALGMTDMEFPNPMRPGDRITLMSMVTQKRSSKTKPDRGIIHYVVRVTNQNDELVSTYRIKIMVAKRTR
ncbi:MAG: acyl dehydratase [Chloroflexi bacterium]|jgi:acyl dehydratase|nr:acyl dehydratase [Chloroflexota bacterium]